MVNGFGGNRNEHMEVREKRIMNNLKHAILTVYLLIGTLQALGAAADVELTVYTDEPTHAISPVLYGLFFEDINFAADGGLYAELVQNRSFEYYPVEGGNPLSGRYHPLYAWEKVERNGGRCRMDVERSIPLNRNNPHYLVLHVDEPGEGAGVLNPGYDGIRVDQGQRYDVSFYARHTGNRNASVAPITVSLESETGQSYGSVVFDRITDDWRKYEGVIQVRETSDQARLVLTASGRGTLCLDMISLFPQNTFNNRKNGLRADLVQSLADLKPKFFRFPGGCIAHGHSLQNAYLWKDSVGDVAQRRPNWNRWGYHQTYGLGYYEYFLLCEDIGATPLPVLPVGVSCGFNVPFQSVPMDELQPWIDDVLDLIEFANGKVDSRWGKFRAAMGHSEPFNLEYVCLGNEEHDTPECRERFPYFVKAIRAAYPDIKIIGTSGLGEGIPLYPLMKELDVYSSDEHYYNSPEWYLRNVNRFDGFDRKGPKIFVGEYASRGNKLFNALAEAAYLTGIERNCDMVDMACYAPLLAHADHTQWNAANLIRFDKRTVMETPNYHVQKLFSTYQGTAYLKNELKENAGERQKPGGRIGLCTWQTTAEFKDVKVSRGGTTLFSSPKRQDWQTVSGRWEFAGGSIRQSDERLSGAVCLAGKTDWSDYTLSLKARKISGREGFIIIFRRDPYDNGLQWNLGGWGNTKHAIQGVVGDDSSIVTEVPGSIETDRWYDIQIVLSGENVRCLLDGRDIHSLRVPVSPTQRVFASCTQDEQTNTICIKTVNPTPEAVSLKVNLKGQAAYDSTASVFLVTGEGPAAENTMSQPNTVSLTTAALKDAGTDFTYALKPYSVVFFELKQHENAEPKRAVKR
jgi:alpha-L-arabinofuranosidase